MLASAGDDGNVILWVPAEPGAKVLAMGDENYDDKETWRLKHMCRSMGAEIYDLAWSPDGAFFITGSMDNVARVWNTQTGGCVRQIAEHNHYVQGVAWVWRKCTLSRDVHAHTDNRIHWESFLLRRALTVPSIFTRSKPKTDSFHYLNMAKSPEWTSLQGRSPIVQHRLTMRREVK